MLVLESTKSVVEKAEYVSIHDDAITAWAASVERDALRPSGHTLYGYIPGARSQVANLVLLIDALNFCFWSEDPISIEWRGETYHRFEAMLVSIILAAKYEPRWCEAEYWLTVPREEIDAVLSGKGTLRMMDERERIIRETGRALIERFDGEFVNAIESVNERAWPLAVLLMTNFESFRDVSHHGGTPVYFMKRAQICALDLSVAWQHQDLPALSGLEELTAFADYRVPQALRSMNILGLTEELAATVEREDEIVKDSPQEVEIRAASIQAVDRMTSALKDAGKAVPAWQVDWYLWDRSHAEDVACKHHRTTTVYY